MKFHKFLYNLIATVVAFALLPACAAGFKEGVRVWSSGHLPHYIQLVANDPQYETTDELVSELMTIAALECLVDTDQGRSKPEAPSMACVCAQPVSLEQREAVCMEWASQRSGIPLEDQYTYIEELPYAGSL
mgnify:CR=1 FL=1